MFGGAAQTVEDLSVHDANTSVTTAITRRCSRLVMTGPLAEIRTHSRPSSICEKAVGLNPIEPRDPPNAAVERYSGSASIS